MPNTTQSKCARESARPIPVKRSTSAAKCAKDSSNFSVVTTRKVFPKSATSPKKNRSAPHANRRTAKLSVAKSTSAATKVPAFIPNSGPTVIHHPSSKVFPAGGWHEVRCPTRTAAWNICSRTRPDLDETLRIFARIASGRAQRARHGPVVCSREQLHALTLRPTAEWCERLLDASPQLWRSLV